MSQLTALTYIKDFIKANPDLRDGLTNERLTDKLEEIQKNPKLLSILLTISDLAANVYVSVNKESLQINSALVLLYLISKDDALGNLYKFNLSPQNFSDFINNNLSEFNLVRPAKEPEPIHVASRDAESNNIPKAVEYA